MAAKKTVENLSCFKEKSLELSEKIEELKKKYTPSIDWVYESSIADLLDDYFQFCFSSSMTGPELDLSRNPYALLAMGDYVNEKNCFFPEIKIMFLFKEYIPEKASDLIKEILYPLWDIGFKAYSYTRTLKDSFKLASKDSRNFFSIYNSRLICGVSLVYTELQDLLRKKIITYRKSDLLNRKYLSDIDRHQQFSNYRYIVEPDPLNVEGGLADYHSLFIMTKIKYDVQTREDLKLMGLITENEYEELNEALDFLRDILFKLKIYYEKERVETEVYKMISEKMRNESRSFDYTHQWFLKEITKRFNVIKGIYGRLILQINPKDIKKIKKKNSSKTVLTNGLKVKGGMLDFNSVNDVIKFPELLIIIYRESINQNIFISPDAKKIIKEFSYILNSYDRKRYLAFFGEILTLAKREDGTLMEMVRNKILENLFPGFEKTASLFEKDGIHEIPVDLHIAETVNNLNSFGTKEIKEKDSFVYKIYHEVVDKKILLWSAFLHHFGVKGKGFPEAYSLINFIFSNDEQKRAVGFLVKNYDILDGFDRKNCKAEDLIKTAEKIRNTETLNNLFLLTISDIKSRSTSGITAEKLSSLKELYSDLESQDVFMD